MKAPTITKTRRREETMTKKEWTELRIFLMSDFHFRMTHFSLEWEESDDDTARLMYFDFLFEYPTLSNLLCLGMSMTCFEAEVARGNIEFASLTKAAVWVIACAKDEISRSRKKWPVIGSPCPKP
jgi:hypothetical protein